MRRGAAWIIGFAFKDANTACAAFDGEVGWLGAG
jgi:hypothetical protein